jgi:hypothetical protein
MCLVRTVVENKRFNVRDMFSNPNSYNSDVVRGDKSGEKRPTSYLGRSD